MRHFDELYAIAEGRKGPLDDLLPTPKTAAELSKTPEDRWLAAMTRGVFQAGFSWKVIEAKWDGFETAFKGFNVDACAMMNDDWFDALITDKSIVRNGSKILSVRDNAVFLQGLRADGGASAVLGGWPSTDYVGLLERLKKGAARQGGTTGQYMLRSMGRDSFILSRDVVGRLIAEGVVDKAPTSKRALAATQEAFNTWMDQSGRGLTQISRVLAMSL